MIITDVYYIDMRSTLQILLSIEKYSRKNFAAVEVLFAPKSNPLKDRIIRNNVSTNGLSEKVVRIIDIEIVIANINV